jgi:hypothetical protein
MVEEVEKSKERPIQGNYPGVCLGGSYSSLVRRGVYNNGVSGPRPTTTCSTKSLQHKRRQPNLIRPPAAGSVKSN